ncbi:MAG: MATE family efflux transporter [Lachnospiraceae bacterium]|nr:MATE family efflux transporter [Lachnospiraceae bacterium]
MRDLTKGNPRSVIMAFAVPVMIGYMLQLCYSLADTRIVSSLIGEEALSAVGATTSLSGMIIGFLNGLTNGFAVIVARYFGAKDWKNLKRSVAASLTCGIIISIILTTACLLGLNTILHVLNVPEKVYDMAYRYIFIIFAGMTMSMLYNISAAFLRAIGDTITPMVFLFVSVVLNIGGDIFCIRVLDLGVRGAAIATVVAQTIACVASLTYMIKRYEILRVSREDFDFGSHMVKLILGGGLSMGFMNCLVNIGSVSLQSGINNLGQEYIVAQTAARKLTEVYMMMFSVLGQTMASYCSQNFGAGLKDRIREGLKQALIIGFIWCGLVVLCTYLTGDILIRLVCGDISKTSIDAAVLYLKVDTVLYWVTMIICILRNSLQGLGDHVTPIVSSSIECVGKILIVMFMVPRLEYMGVILAEPIVWCVMVIPLIIMILKNPSVRGFRKEQA